MMRLYTFLAFLAALLPFSLSAQLDTLLFEDFEGNWEERYLDFYDESAYGSDSIWINFDIDGSQAAQSRPNNWYLSVDFATPDTIPDSLANVVAASSSWLVDFNVQNLNWLILPPMHIVDGQASLNWKSAPYQGPRYLDGYKVLLSTSEIDPFLGTYTDTLFVAAEMLYPLPDGANDPNDDALQIDSFSVSDGYVHANRFTLQEYYTYTEGDDIFVCVLEPHSVSLADYAGQTVYIAFLHDSFDDNLISLDDILVMGNLVSSAGEPSLPDISLVTYPNPVDNYLNVLFQLDEPSQAQLVLYDMKGQRMLALTGEGRVSGEQNLRLDLRRLPAGTYNLVLNVDGARYSRQVVRR
ncbi:MAG: T9SS type A sorting domain-containing protein [Phaeodactylibacter sp.]|nr:T9SS type A sorting domain-containing protein [Phaeodactylibacter sp.]MCB9276075.1 T9SS type A sorting domain-containing protein [Lewinellaceae bacterium]